MSSGRNLYFNFTTDSVQQGRGFLASWSEVRGNSQQSSNSGNYLVSYPTAFIEESPEKICLDLFIENKLGASITTKVYAEKGTDEQNNENWIFSQNTALQEFTVNLEKNEKTKCFEITLPESRGVSKGLLELEIKTNDRSLDIKTFKEITIYRQDIYPLIQTDKGQYKAKDKVKFRVLLLDHRLRPSQQLKSIEEIWVEDPHNRRIAQWKDSVCRDW